MEHRVERIVIETGRHRIVGEVRLPREGYRSRFSDFLNRGDLDFIPITSAQVRSLDGGESETHPFVAVGRMQIVIAYPAEDES